MRILILNFILSTAIDGKIIRRKSNRDTMIHTMARGFVSQGHEVTLAASDDFKPTEEENDLNFEVKYFKSRLPRIFKPHLLPLPKGLGKYLKQHGDDFDMVLSVDVFSFPSIIAARRCRDKMLIWQEMAFLQHMMGGVPAKIWYNIIAPCFIRNIPIVCQSENAKSFIKRYLRNISDQIVGHGSDSERFYPSDESADYFVVVSMLVHRKRIDRIIEKFARFIKNTGKREFRLKIVGEGPEMESLKKLAADTCVGDNVEFLGFMNHDEIASIWRKAKAMLIDTQQDNNMVTIPESIVNGTPVLTNPVPNNATFISQYSLGIVRDGWDWEELQNMSEHYEANHNNCISHSSLFSNKGCADRLIKIYNSNNA
ncbi:MAG: glycosyltransferase family 4 protein [Bacteroides sp.]|nr:glycosyltransferase family 4 protein [Bacteroides sp.]MCM1413265.1 glycosyltransferase family 4 protein [Bacteroides sp.]MCM1471425.1 glycosyltransferase family 4 protein [Bacteroides sp.]